MLRRAKTALVLVYALAIAPGSLIFAGLAVAGAPAAVLWAHCGTYLAGIVLGLAPAFLIQRGALSMMRLAQGAIEELQDILREQQTMLAASQKRELMARAELARSEAVDLEQ